MNWANVVPITAFIVLIGGFLLVGSLIYYGVMDIHGLKAVANCLSYSVPLVDMHSHYRTQTNPIPLDRTQYRRNSNQTQNTTIIIQVNENIQEEALPLYQPELPSYEANDKIEENIVCISLAVILALIIILFAWIGHMDERNNMFIASYLNPLHGVYGDPIHSQVHQNMQQTNNQNRRQHHNQNMSTNGQANRGISVETLPAYESNQPPHYSDELPVVIQVCPSYRSNVSH
ncbi:hypothetical protein BC833DRAFT_564606 [Globomyces pollinis-pini]|nr:hypothetical protein BC833DRAFT_564606 [Globomyces pollinis-pini]